MNDDLIIASVICFIVMTVLVIRELIIKEIDDEEDDITCTHGFHYDYCSVCSH